jgi:site-specific recombinase XerD
MGKLRDQMLADLQLCGAKPRTQETYLREAENLAKYFNRSPAELGENELKEYLLYLIKERHLSEGTFRFYVAGLKFLYRTTLKREWPAEKIKHSKSGKKLPILSFPIISRPIATYLGARIWSVSVQTGQQGSLLTRLSMGKIEK